MTTCDSAHSLSRTYADSLADVLERELFDRHGPLIADEALRAALGYRSMEAFRQALARKTLPVPVFGLAHRRGKYALVKDVAIWLASVRAQGQPLPKSSDDVNVVLRAKEVAPER